MKHKRESEDEHESRRAFEQWARIEFQYKPHWQFSYRLNKAGKPYVNEEIQHAWQGWQAATKLERERVLRTLASAVKKILPPKMVKDLLSRADPLSVFLEAIRTLGGH